MENVRSVRILRNLKWVSRYFNSVKMSGSTSLCRSSVKNVRTSFIFLRASFMPARNCRSFLTSPAKNARIRSHIRRNSPPLRFLRTAGFACSSSLCSAGSGFFAPAQTFFACLSSNVPPLPAHCLPGCCLFSAPRLSGGHLPHCALRVLLHRPPGHPPRVLHRPAFFLSGCPKDPQL